ncbi:MAG: hypothetical protein QXP36_00035 [Conexivisphaerales archaeon]
MIKAKEDVKEEQQGTVQREGRGIIQNLVDAAQKIENTYVKGGFQKFVEENFEQFKDLFNSHIAVKGLLKVNEVGDVEKLLSDPKLSNLVYPVIADIFLSIKRKNTTADQQPATDAQKEILKQAKVTVDFDHITKQDATNMIKNLPATESQKKYINLLAKRLAKILEKQNIEIPKDLNNITRGEAQEFLSTLKFVALRKEIFKVVLPTRKKTKQKDEGEQLG